MFILDLFEAQQKQTLVLIPGGFHPFHPGHLSLYRAAEQAFPGARIVYVATDDRKDRPFPFAEKQKLAQIAGVNPKNFQLVKSPFVAKEVTSQYDPNNTVLIFARSEKDRDEQPKPGGVKKDGSPSYLQPYTKGNLAPMSQHGYMAYLPVVQFDAGPSGVTSATQIRNMWPQADDAQKNEIVTDLYPKNPQVAKQILDQYLGSAVAEGLLDKFVKPKLKFNIETAGEELYVDVTLGGKRVAGFTFDMLGDDLEAQDMSVSPEYRGQGIAQTVYDMLKAKGFRINRSQHQTDAGSHFWDKNKGAGSKVWEQDVAEDYENLTENFGGLSLKAINEILIIIPRITNRLSDTVGPMARDIANMTKLLPKVIRGQASPEEKAFVGREAKEVLQIAVSAWLSHYMTALGKTVGHMMPNELTQKITEYVTEYVGEGVVLKKVFDALQTERNKQWHDQNAAERAAALQYDKQHPEQDPHLLYKKTRQDPLAGGGMMEDELDEHIGKVKGGYRLYSHTGKNLGTFGSKAGAEKHEREVEYFKHKKESVNEDVLTQLDSIAKSAGIL
jgi:glycerol-3-phosphate cytidylyltransferase-like family protein/GNAT superfamily N-acetyltransferase